MRLRTLMLSTLASVLAACSWAPEEENYDPPYDDYAGSWGQYDTPSNLAPLLTCANHDPQLLQQVGDLMANISSPKTTIKSLDSFVAALPLQIRQNVMFWTETRAFQRIYPLSQQEKVSQLPISTADRSFHNDSGRWCVSAKEGGGKSCLEARVLLSSTEGDFLGTFTTHPQSPSRGSFEIALFDPTRATLDYFDIAFKDGARPTVAKNPDKCMTCHGGRDGTINYRMDPYRLWAYSTPFNEDLLRPGSVETEWYLSFLDRIEAGAPVLRHLAPINDKKTIVAELQKGPYQLKAVPASVDFRATDSPALNFTHQILEKNACRIASSMARRPDFDQIKYAAVGGLMNCPNVNDFLPTEGSYQQGNAERHFEGMRMGLKDGRFDLATMLGETEAKHVRLLADRLSRRYDHFVQYAGEETAAAELTEAVNQAPVQARYGVTNYETYAEQITKARYLLEPLGVDVAQWSMAVDSEFDSHVEFLYPAALQPVFLDMLKREFDLDSRIGQSLGLSDCNNMSIKDGSQGRARSCKFAIDAVLPDLCIDLAARSREALTNIDSKLDRFDGLVLEPSEALEAEARALADASSLEQLNQTAKGVYTTYCLGCHKATYGQGAWYYPFDNIAQLNNLIRREKTASIHVLDGQRLGLAGNAKGDWAFDYVSAGDRIWDRVTRHPRQHGIMPRFSLTGLDRRDKVTLRAHMLKVWDEK